MCYRCFSVFVQFVYRVGVTCYRLFTVLLACLVALDRFLYRPGYLMEWIACMGWDGQLMGCVEYLMGWIG